MKLTVAQLYRAVGTHDTHKELMFALQPGYPKEYWRIFKKAEQAGVIAVDRSRYPYRLRRK